MHVSYSYVDTPRIIYYLIIGSVDWSKTEARAARGISKISDYRTDHRINPFGIESFGR